MEQHRVPVQGNKASNLIENTSGGCGGTGNSPPHRRFCWRDPQGPRTYMNSPTLESAPEGPNLLVSSGGSDWKLAECRTNSTVPSRTPPPYTQWCGVPHPGEHLRLRPLLCNRLTETKKKKKMAQMKEQIKAPEKRQLSNEEIANLSDAQFKTLVIRMLTELVELVTN